MIGVLRSEWTKFYSSPWCMAGMIGAILVAPVIVLIMMSSNVSNELSSTTSNMLSQCLSALILGQLGIVIMAASFFGQEYEQSSLRTTFLVVPSRMKIFRAKLIVLTIVAIFTGMLSSLLCLTVGIINYDCSLTFQLATNFMGNVAIVMICWIQIAWLSLTLSVLTKSQVVPIAIMGSLVFGLGDMLFLISKFAKYLPVLAAKNLFLTPDTPMFLDTWQGVAIQFAWVVLFGANAIWLILHRDVR